MTNILLTSVGRRSYIVDYFKKAICNQGLIHVSNSTYTTAMDIADKYLITPLIYDDKYIPTILNYCLENNIIAVISLFDVDVLVLAKNRDLFLKNNIRIILAPEKSIKICNDKWDTYNFLLNHKIKTPNTFLTINEALDSLRNKIIAYPLVLKPRWGMASIGLYFAENKEELNVFYNKSYRDVFRTHLKYESESTKNAAILIQEYIPGQEYGLDVINDLKANYVTTFAKKKITMRAGETDIGETVDSTIFSDIAKLLSKYIQHEGILSVDCIINDNGIYVIEMNCRISGHYPISHLAGVNFPKQLINWINNEPTNLNLLKIKEGLLVTKDLVPKIITMPRQTEKSTV